mmetsp:Transcript_13026/g.28137  ORF Transcript_13026/g.28137 Transcript_13026/m.28137 type:complete len:100 (-) Transcript_13026:205-504(-)
MRNQHGVLKLFASLLLMLEASGAANFRCCYWYSPVVIPRSTPDAAKATVQGGIIQPLPLAFTAEIVATKEGDTMVVVDVASAREPADVSSAVAEVVIPP